MKVSQTIASRAAEVIRQARPEEGADDPVSK
jgi:hypothetical protein